MIKLINSSKGLLEHDVREFFFISVLLSLEKRTNVRYNMIEVQRALCKQRKG